MSDLFASVNGERIISGSLCIPYFRMWVADVVLASASELATACTLQIANLKLTGHIFRMASFSGSKSARIVGGYGGWRKVLAEQSYTNANGVKLGLVMGDAASLAGEQINVVDDRTIGTYYIREKAKGTQVLAQHLGPTWYVDTKGVTQAQDRTDKSKIESDFTVVAWSGGKGRFEIATEDIASWLPARTFSSATVPDLQSISMTTVDFDNAGKLRLGVLTAGHEDA